MKIKGFTLVEIIITIVLLGIVAGIGLGILSKIFTGYVNTRTYTMLYFNAKFIAERIDRELRHAVPNSIRIGNSGKTLQFCEFKFGSFYKQISKDNITVYDNLSIKVGDNISIYNTNPTKIYQSKERVYTIIDNSSYPILKLNKKIVKNSPANRFFLILTPVTFFWYNGILYRRFNYPINFSDFGDDISTCNDDPFCNIVSKYVKSITFNYSGPTLERNAIVFITIVMEKDNVVVKYNAVVHIRNVP